MHADDSGFLKKIEVENVSFISAKSAFPIDAPK